MQDCAAKHSSNGVGFVNGGGNETNAMKQNLARATLAKQVRESEFLHFYNIDFFNIHFFILQSLNILLRQALEVEKIELVRKVEELEKKLLNRNGVSASSDLKVHLEDLVKKHQQDQHGTDNSGTVS